MDTTLQQVHRFLEYARRSNNPGLQLVIPLLSAVVARRLLRKDLQLDVAFILPFWFLCYIAAPALPKNLQDNATEDSAEGNDPNTPILQQLRELNATLTRHVEQHKRELEVLHKAIEAKDDEMRKALEKQRRELLAKFELEHPGSTSSSSYIDSLMANSTGPKLSTDGSVCNLKSQV
jgi:hypothetical protein